MTDKLSFIKVKLANGKWIIFEKGHDYKRPLTTDTFAFDTENLVYFDGVVITQNELYERLNGLDTEEKRKHLSSVVWAWQCYDEFNGFFMTNDFEQWLEYQAKAKYKFGWCYNAKFDFSQIDYQVLAEYKDKWKEHQIKTGKAYNKAQPYTYSSLHNSMGARYSYKLWWPCKRGNDRHLRTHAIEYRDFMNLCVGGLKNLLNDLNVVDNEGTPIRKLEMDYQAVDPNKLTYQEIMYCMNDVKGLYFAIKQFNTVIEEQSNNESHVFGALTNIITSGGFAKAELLRSMYPQYQSTRERLKRYQKEHPMEDFQDKYFRDNHLYRGGICVVNPYYQGRLLTKEQIGSPMYRFDVNSEYPYAMANIRDLVGYPIKMSYKEWLTADKSFKEEYECILVLNKVYGELKEGYVKTWYDPEMHDFVEEVDEDFTHLMFEIEMKEMLNWYDLTFSCDEVILFKRGEYAYRPFIEENYQLKAQAKKDKNKTLQQCTKLKLNSSYGKLAERVEREKGHFELNEESGAIHFIVDEVEQDTSKIMSVAVGSLVTATARVYILSHIRLICKEEQMSKLFVYIDTDSIHCFANYEGADAYKLGGLKLEAVCDAVKYLAPKTYIDIEEVIDGKTKADKCEIHTKGVNVKVVKDSLDQQDLSLDFIDKRMDYGVKFTCLQAMNVKGGKVLVPTDKMLANYDLSPEGVYIDGYGGMYTEV